MKQLTENEREIVKAGFATPFWNTLVEHLLNPQIDALTKSVIEDDALSEFGNVSKRDLARFWLRLLKSVRDFPVLVGAQNKPVQEGEEKHADDFDPYPTVENIDREWERIKPKS